MNKIWDAVAACLRSVAQQLGDTKVIAIGLTGQGDGLWLVDADGEPVRPVATWMDGPGCRSGPDLDRGRPSQQDARSHRDVRLRRAVPVLIEELAATEPDAVARAATHLNCKDWLRLKLTGIRSTDYTEASRSFLDVRDGSGFSTSLAEEVGLSEMVRLLPEIRPADGEASPLSAQGAAATGLPEGTPVGVGMIDVAVTGMGLGIVEDGASWTPGHRRLGKACR